MVIRDLLQIQHEISNSHNRSPQEYNLKLRTQEEAGPRSKSMMPKECQERESDR